MTSTDVDVTVSWDESGRVATIAFVGPGKVNEINEDVILALRASIDGLRRGPLPRVLILRGSDSMFSGGADLRMFLELDEPTYVRFVTTEYEFCRTIEALPCVTIAALTGPCLGYAFELALACDFRVSRAEAKVGFPETRVGWMSPAQRLSRYVGLEVARELTIGARIMRAREAAELGLISLCTTDEGFEEGLSDFVARYAAAAPVAVEVTKRNLALAYGSVVNHDPYEIAAATKTFHTADLREGIVAALERRAPSFEGV